MDNFVGSGGKMFSICQLLFDTIALLFSLLHAMMEVCLIPIS